MPTQLVADGIPDEHGIFRGLAQAPLHFHNAVAELIDNAIAAKEKKFNVLVDVSDSNVPNIYYLSVVDDCLGIPLNKLQSHVFKVGKLPPAGSSHLREHGFGLKNVLAKTEAVKGSWEILTKDSNIAGKRRFYLTKGPLRFRLPIAKLTYSKWPTWARGSDRTAKSPFASTAIRLKLPLSYLQTVARGMRGAPPKSLGAIVDYLREHLGVFYRGYLEGKRPEGNIFTSINLEKPEEVEPVEPDFRKYTKVSFPVSTRKGKIQIEGGYGELESKSPQTRGRKYYYKISPESQGVDFRIGNRVIATRLLKEIWEKERHPTLNPFCGEFRIAAGSKVLRTLNNKTSIDYDDEVWTDISEAIRNKVKLPTWKGARTEAEMRDALIKILRANKRPRDTVEPDYPCFGGAGVVIDIYRDEIKRTGELIIYEAKVGKASPLDVYQLRMYWDGLVLDGKQPTEGILVADQWTSRVSSVVSYLNGLKDQNKKRYQLNLKKWEDFNIQQ